MSRNFNQAWSKPDFITPKRTTIVSSLDAKVERGAISWDVPLSTDYLDETILVNRRRRSEKYVSNFARHRHNIY